VQKNSTGSHTKYARDVRNAAGEWQMGTLCGSLPRDARLGRSVADVVTYGMLIGSGFTLDAKFRILSLA